MLVLGQYWRGTLHPTAAVLAKRRREMEQRWKATSTKSNYILGLGKQHRNYWLLLPSLKALGLNIKIASNGKASLPKCSEMQPKGRRCVLLKQLQKEALHSVISNALMVVIPTSAGYYDGSGSSALIDALMFGKIILLSDTGNTMQDGFVVDGVNGFLLPPWNATAWFLAMQQVVNMRNDEVRSLERKSFDIAERWTQENLTATFLETISGMAASHSGHTQNVMGLS